MNGEGFETVVPTLGGSVAWGIDIDPVDGPLGGKIYWSQTSATGNGQIIRASAFQGINQEVLITDVVFPRDICLDLEMRKLYWADSERGQIRRANLDGTGMETVVASGLVYPSGIAIDSHNGKLYWMDAGRELVERANLDGTGREALFELARLSRVALRKDDSVSLDPKSWSEVKAMFRGVRAVNAKDQ